MRLIGTLLPGLLALQLAGGVAQAQPARSRADAASAARSERSFRRIATLPNALNNADPSDETVSEIVASTADGLTLIYTDGVLGELGFIDVADPSEPLPLGKLSLGGEPTSVAVLGSDLALVGVNTSGSFTALSGHVAVVEIGAQRVVATLDVGGQPDSVAISPDGQFAAVAIENERDEDVVVDGVEGGLPQAPAGSLAILDLDGDDPAAWGVRFADLTGLTAYAPDDPEPEFVDIDRDNRAVVTLQENNHVVIVDLRSGAVVSDFSAGTQTLVGIDATEDDRISLTETLMEVPREPDAVTWLSGGRGRRTLATANEGDLFGGSRGFSIFDEQGTVLYDSGSAFEELAVRHGHYPEARSENKGTEPEAIEYARFGRTDYLFVGSERGSFVAVYELSRRNQPRLVQVLPGPLAPEGLHAIPSRGLLVVAGEADDPAFGVRSSVMIYELGTAGPSYPEILSADDASGKPIAWSALSGMVAVPGARNQLLAVSDSFYAETTIFTIDASRRPALITAAMPVVGGSGDFDAEGITVAPDGTLWIASEGNDGDRLNRLIHTDLAGQVLQEVFLPEQIEACRAASTNRGTLGSGFEGVTVSRVGRGYRLLVAQQRGWDFTTPECEDLDDDPAGLNSGEPTQTRIWSYDPRRAIWSHFSYALEPVPDNASWVGLSEITAVPDGFVVIERDNRTGDFADLKTLVRFGRRAPNDGGVSGDEKRVHDLLPALLATHGWISDKPEGVAITRDGRVFVVTDNDGVDDWSGETWFLSLGRLNQLF